MNLSVKQPDKKELFERESGIIGLGITLYVIYFIAMSVFAADVACEIFKAGKGLLLAYLAGIGITALTSLPWLVSFIVNKVRLSRILKKTRERFNISYGNYSDYKDFESALFEISQNMKFDGVRLPIKAGIKNPRRYANKSIYAIYIRCLIEGYLGYLNENKKAGIIDTLSLLEISTGEKEKQVRRKFIESRSDAFIDYFLYYKNFVSIDDTLAELKKYSDVNKKNKGKKETLSFNSYDVLNIEKIIKKNVVVDYLVPMFSGVLLFGATMASIFLALGDKFVYFLVITTFAIIIIVMIAFIIKVANESRYMKKLEDKYYDVAKYLPITKEEFESLQITKYEEIESIVFNMFNDKNDGDYDSSYLETFNELIKQTLENYLNSYADTDIKAKELRENSFIVYKTDGSELNYNFISMFAKERTKAITDMLSGEEDIETIDETYQNLLIEAKAERSECNIMMANGKVTIVDFKK